MLAELTLPRDLVGRGTLFGLRVRGDSMIDEEATVKVYRRRAGRVVLEPRNRAYENIDGDRAVVLGKVVSVLRRT